MRHRSESGDTPFRKEEGEEDGKGEGERETEGEKKIRIGGAQERKCTEEKERRIEGKRESKEQERGAEQRIYHPRTEIHTHRITWASTAGSA